jgi:hypothetical protein
VRERHDFLLHFSFVAVPDCWLEGCGLVRLDDIGITISVVRWSEKGTRVV